MDLAATTEYLTLRQKTMEDELLKLADSQLLREKMREYIDLTKALSEVRSVSIQQPPTESIRFLGHNQAIDAIEDVLDDHSGRGMRKAEIVNEVCAGGWAPNDKYRKKNVGESIRYWLNPQPKRPSVSGIKRKADPKPRLIEKDGLVYKAPPETPTPDPAV